MNHGSPQPVTIDEFLLTVMADCDPDLLLVTADPVVWDAAHPCECDGVCECEERVSRDPWFEARA